MWAVAAQPRVGLTPMIPTPSFDRPDFTLFKPPVLCGQNHHGLDGSCLCRVLCCNVDLIERVSADESVERQPALLVQLDEPWNELSRVAVALIRPDQANAATQQVWYVGGDLRA